MPHPSEPNQTIKTIDRLVIGTREVRGIMLFEIIDIVADLHEKKVIYQFCSWFFYICAPIPFATRIALMHYNVHEYLSKELTELEQARESYRPYIIAYLTVSIAVLLALTIANAKSAANLYDAIFCAVISFVGFELALSKLRYKFTVFDDQIIDSLLDNSRFGLYLTVIAVINNAIGVTSFSIIIILILILGFVYDFCNKLRYDILAIRNSQ
jgi:hypothetical protein